MSLVSLLAVLPVEADFPVLIGELLLTCRASLEADTATLHANVDAIFSLVLADGPSLRSAYCFKTDRFTLPGSS